MKQLLLSFLFIALFASPLLAQDTTPAPAKQFMQITTIESVVGGGMGRSKMIITHSDGSQKDTLLNNLYSMTGINFKNIGENDQQILQTLKSYTDQGWKLEQAIPLSHSPGSGSGGIFMTRYLLSRPDQQK
jgi:hypothetical protein